MVSWSNAKCETLRRNNVSKPRRTLIALLNLLSHPSERSRGLGRFASFDGGATSLPEGEPKGRGRGGTINLGIIILRTLNVQLEY